MKAFLTIIVLAALVFSMISCSEGNSEGCGIGWRRTQNKCYLLSNLQFNWFNALDFCRSVGGRLAVPKNEREHQFLRWMARHSGKEYIWIGVADFIAEGKWLTFPDMWHAKYFTWGYKQPDERTKGNCVDMIRAYDYKWNDAPCGAVINFICEKAK
uniref:C-type lectin domain-containing protein n=1 Tax=Pinctada fucata TaxID=50426 RepID=A0A194ALB7_PINFU